MEPMPQVLWWSMGLDDVDAAAFDALASVCSPREREAAERFRFDRDRRAYLAAHGLLRRALSACAPRHAPTAWTFVRTAHGRPALDAHFDAGLRFSLSHCATRVGCVVVRDVDCGIDIEPANREVDTALLGPQCLSRAEQRWVHAGARAQRALRFLRLWTLKEAVAKAVGLGLSLPFADLAFALDPVPRLAAMPAGVGDAWWLLQDAAADGHVEALALRLPARRSVALSRRAWPHPARLAEGDSRTLGTLGTQHPEHDRARDGLLARHDAQLGRGILQMKHHGTFADVEKLADLPAGLAFGRPAETLDFAAAQLRRERCPAFVADAAECLVQADGEMQDERDRPFQELHAPRRAQAQHDAAPGQAAVADGHGDAAGDPRLGRAPQDAFAFGRQRFQEMGMVVGQPRDGCYEVLAVVRERVGILATMALVHFPPREGEVVRGVILLARGADREADGIQPVIEPMSGKMGVDGGPDFFLALAVNQLFNPLDTHYEEFLRADPGREGDADGDAWRA
jgi:4'-phosphopantetheinyl transferase